MAASAASSVYPRYRGEHVFLFRRPYFLPGLSPLPRGTPQYQVPASVRRRFIPATAGNTVVSLTVLFVVAVYPRYRGEHGRTDTGMRSKIGLSPLPRGTLYYRHTAGKRGRFIPATAGNTLMRYPFFTLITVYPRYRGEHYLICRKECARGGLSPLPRGTHPAMRLFTAIRRFIPATAGNTREDSKRNPIFTVYPRYRGEHTLIIIRIIDIAGLSPLPRGTLLPG